MKVAEHVLHRLYKVQKYIDLNTLIIEIQRM